MYYIYIYICKRIIMYIHSYVYVYIYIYTHTYIMCIYIYIYVYIHIHMCIHIYIYIYTHTHVYTYSNNNRGLRQRVACTLRHGDVSGLEALGPGHRIGKALFGLFARHDRPLPCQAPLPPSPREWGPACPSAIHPHFVGGYTHRHNISCARRSKHVALKVSV